MDETGHNRRGKAGGEMRLLTTNTHAHSDGGDEAGATEIDEDAAAAVGEEEEDDDGTWRPAAR